MGIAGGEGRRFLVFFCKSFDNMIMSRKAVKERKDTMLVLRGLGWSVIVIKMLGLQEGEVYIYICETT